jgi:hypothetical protein
MLVNIFTIKTETKNPRNVNEIFPENIKIDVFSQDVLYQIFI